MRFFKSREEKQREAERNVAIKQKETEEWRENRRLEEELNKMVVITPETKTEYEKRVGYEVKIIDLGRRNIGICVHPYNLTDSEWRLSTCTSDLKKLIDERVEAIVNTSAYGGYFCGNWKYPAYYGLPVAKRK